jgi:hypothetical protein
LKAAEAVYGIALPPEVLAMCCGLSSGFGVGELCGCLIGAVMAFGLFFDECAVKRLRLKLLSEFCGDGGCLHCLSLRNDSFYCEGLVGDIAERTENLIDKERANSFG